MSLQIAYITAQFRTNDDDKDDDTQVLITISPYTDGARGHNIAAYDGNLFGRLPDNSNSSPVTLGFKDDAVWTSGAEYVLTISINPNGHDTWKFDCYLSFVFRNAPPQVFTFPGHWLSQNVRSNDYRFVL